MISRLRSAFGHIRALRQLSSFGFTAENIRRIRRTYIRMFVFGGGDRTAGRANIAGYKVDYLSRSALWYSFQEIFVDNDYLFETSSDRPVILDCGSNIGLSILYFKLLYPNATVTAFEPEPSAFRCLERNVRQNRFQGVHVNRLALSDQEGEVELYFDPDEAGSLRASTIEERMQAEKLMVESARLSRFVEGDIDFLKMDVEGAELAILHDLESSGKLRHIKKMVIEYHHHIASDQNTMSILLSILERAGFGYQIEASRARPRRPGKFQDILVYAYDKRVSG